MTRYAALLALPLALAGCNDGGPTVSGSADDGARSSSGQSTLWERVFGVTIDNSKTVDMPALALMADAFQANPASERMMPIASQILTAHETDGSILTLDLQAAHQETVFSESWATVLPKVRAAAGSPAHLALELPILVALTARKGWEVNAMAPDPAFDTPFFRANRRGSEYDPELHRRYMEMLAASAIYTNDVFGVISQQLGGRARHDLDPRRWRLVWRWARQRSVGQFQARVDRLAIAAASAKRNDLDRCRRAGRRHKQRRTGKMTLETYDPDWEAKWDEAHAEFVRLEAPDFSSLTPNSVERMQFLSRELCRLCDAGLRTPNEYLQRHLSHVLRQAEGFGLIIPFPDLREDAGIAATVAIVSDIGGLVQREERQRSLAAAMERAGLDYSPPPGPTRIVPLAWWKRVLWRLVENRTCTASPRQARPKAALPSFASDTPKLT